MPAGCASLADESASTADSSEPDPEAADGSAACAACWPSVNGLGNEGWGSALTGAAGCGCPAAGESGSAAAAGLGWAGKDGTPPSTGLNSAVTLGLALGLTSFTGSLLTGAAAGLGAACCWDAPG